MSALVVSVLYLVYLGLGLYVDYPDLFGSVGSFLLLLGVHLGVGAFLNHRAAAALPLLGIPMALPAPAGDDGDTPVVGLMIYFVPFGAALILAGFGLRRLGQRVLRSHETAAESRDEPRASK